MIWNLVRRDYMATGALKGKTASGILDRVNHEGIQIFSSDAVSYIDLLRFQREFLLEVMGERWFHTSRPGHPAYQRYQILSAWIQREGFVDGSVPVAEVAFLPRILLDSHLLAV